MGGAILTITNPNLASLFAALSESERLAIRAHLAGRVTEESRELMRALRRKLKRKIRARVPRLKWLA
jgi:hypothetical protein